MIKQLAIWYLRKKKVQIIMNIHFLDDAYITGRVSKDFVFNDNDGESLNVQPNVDKSQ